MCRKRLSTNDSQNNEFLETLKSNYKQRIEELDNFSRNLSNSSADFRSQYLIGLSDMLQHYLDLQKKLIKDYPSWYDADLMGKQSGMITESLVNTIHNMNSFYSSSLDFWTKNIRVFNQGMMQVMQMTERLNDMSEKVPAIQKNVLIDLIKQEKEYNGDVTQKQIQKKSSSSSS